MIDLQEYEWRHWSQHGEDGVIKKIIETIEIDKLNPVFLEIGAHFHEANCLRLQQHEKWRGFYFDDFHEFHPLGFYKMWITKDNIVDVLKSSYPKEFDLFSLDIDGNDFYVLKSILKEFIPRILCIEINASLLDEEEKVIPYDENFRWDGTSFYGASSKAYQKLCEMHNYSVVYIESSGTNMFLIKNDYLLSSKDSFLNVNNLKFHFSRIKTKENFHPQDPQNRKFLTFEEALKV
jgi:hypothetical protein